MVQTWNSNRTASSRTIVYHPVMWNRVSAVIALLLIIQLALCLDVSFIPNDENAPLPLSQKYRDSLRKLCSVMNAGSGKLHPELVEKKAVLEKMCKKLAKDDGNISASIPNFPKLDLRALTFSLLGVGGGYVMWSNRHWIGDNVQKILLQNRAIPVQRADNNRAAAGAANDQVHHLDMDAANRRVIEAREARLRRFAEINVNADANVN